MKEAIGRRLKGETDRCREVLTLASVLGREFSPAILEQASGLKRDELLDALDEAASARLVDDVPDARGRLRFSHVLIRDVLYEELATARRLHLHRTVAAALESIHAGNLEPHLAELAHHYLAGGAGEASKALEFATAAGDRAASQLAYEEAARHYTSALRVSRDARTGRWN